MTTTPKALRSRALTSAKRSLGLISELIDGHLKTLENGGVPDAGFSASVQKYEESRVKLLILDALASDDGSAAELEGQDEVCVQQEDLDILAAALTEFVRSAPRHTAAGCTGCSITPPSICRPAARGSSAACSSSGSWL